MMNTLFIQINPFFFNTSTSSATSLTMTPFWRCAGGRSYGLAAARR